MLIDCSFVTVSGHESIWNTAFKLCLHRIECCWFESAHPIGWRAPRDAKMFFWVGPGVACFFHPLSSLLHALCFWVPTSHTLVVVFYFFFGQLDGVSNCLISSAIAIHEVCYFKFQKQSGNAKGDKRLKVKNCLSL